MSAEGGGGGCSSSGGGSPPSSSDSGEPTRTPNNGEIGNREGSNSAAAPTESPPPQTEEEVERKKKREEEIKAAARAYALSDTSKQAGGKRRRAAAAAGRGRGAKLPPAIPPPPPGVGAFPPLYHYHQYQYRRNLLHQAPPPPHPPPCHHGQNLLDERTNSGRARGRGRGGRGTGKTRGRAILPQSCPYSPPSLQQSPGSSPPAVNPAVEAAHKRLLHQKAAAAATAVVADEAVAAKAAPAAADAAATTEPPPQAGANAGKKVEPNPLISSRPTMTLDDLDDYEFFMHNLHSLDDLSVLEGLADNDDDEEDFTLDSLEEEEDDDDIVGDGGDDGDDDNDDDVGVGDNGNSSNRDDATFVDGKDNATKTRNSDQLQHLAGDAAVEAARSTAGAGGAGGGGEGEVEAYSGSLASAGIAPSPPTTAAASADFAIEDVGIDKLETDFYQQLEEELDWLEEEDMEAAVATLLLDNRIPAGGGDSSTSGSVNGSKPKGIAAGASRLPRSRTGSPVATHQANSFITYPNRVPMMHPTISPSTAVDSGGCTKDFSHNSNHNHENHSFHGDRNDVPTHMKASRVVMATEKQQRQFRGLLANHFQLLLQQATLAARSAHSHKNFKNWNPTDPAANSTPTGSEKPNDLIEILDGAVGMLQDLDQHRKDAIRRYVQFNGDKIAATSETSTTVPSSPMPQVQTTNHSSDAAQRHGAMASPVSSQQRRLTRAQFTKTLVQQQLEKGGEKATIFATSGLAKLPELFRMIDMSVAGVKDDSVLPCNILQPQTNTEACTKILEHAGADCSKEFVPGTRDLSSSFVDPREHFGPHFKPPCDTRQEASLRKNRNIFTTGEDNLVLRGVNLYGEKQWQLVSDRFLPDRSANLIQQRHAKLCVMIYKSHGIRIDEEGNLDPPPQSERIEDASKTLVQTLHRVEAPAILNVHRWSLEEDLTLLRAVPILGNMWVEIRGRYLPHRDRRHLRKRYQVLERRVKAAVQRDRESFSSPRANTSPRGNKQTSTTQRLESRINSSATTEAKTQSQRSLGTLTNSPSAASTAAKALPDPSPTKPMASHCSGPSVAKAPPRPSSSKPTQGPSSAPAVAAPPLRSPNERRTVPSSIPTAAAPPQRYSGKPTSNAKPGPAANKDKPVSWSQALPTSERLKTCAETASILNTARPATSVSTRPPLNPLVVVATKPPPNAHAYSTTRAGAYAPRLQPSRITALPPRPPVITTIQSPPTPNAFIEESSRAAFEKLARDSGGECSQMSGIHRLMNHDQTSESTVANANLAQLANQQTPPAMRTSASCLGDGSTPDSLAGINIDEPASGLSMLNSVMSASFKAGGHEIDCQQRKPPKKAISFLTGVLQRSKPADAAQHATGALPTSKKRSALAAAFDPPPVPPAQGKMYSAPTAVAYNQAHAVSATPPRRSSCPAERSSSMNNATTSSTPLPLSSVFPSTFSPEMKSVEGATQGSFAIASGAILGNPPLTRDSNNTTLLEGSRLGKAFDSSTAAFSSRQMDASGLDRLLEPDTLEAVSALNSLLHSTPESAKDGDATSDVHNSSTSTEKDRGQGNQSFFAQAIGETGRATSSKKRKLMF